MLFKMEINRDNYEEYFLLYADNELTDYEKIEVLKFIRANKDLEDEFKMIQDTVCKPDNVVMENKGTLLKANESDLITEKNYEEIFVLYHDGELNNEEKNMTELFISRYPLLKKEFDAIGKARLFPDDTIGFSWKNKLYKGKKSGRVVPLIFWRSIAAAVFIGFGFWIFQAYYRQPAKMPDIVKDIKPVEKAETKSLKVLPQEKSKNSNITEADHRSNSIAETKKPSFKKEVITQKGELEKGQPSYVQRNGSERKKTDDLIKKTPPENVEPELASLEDDIKKIPEKKTIDTDGISFTGDIEIKPLHDDDINSKPAIKSQPASYVAAANEKNENYVFYNITTEEFRKSKVGGFLKKVKRIVERNNPVSRIFSGDEKQIASN